MQDDTNIFCDMITFDMQKNQLNVKYSAYHGPCYIFSIFRSVKYLVFLVRNEKIQSIDLK